MHTQFPTLLPQQAWPAPGTVVSSPIILGFRHFGIVSERMLDGKPTVLSASNRRGFACEEAWDVFTPTGEYAIENLSGPLCGYEVVEMARRALGTRYSILNWNCDHFVHHAVGLAPRSPQVGVCIASAILVALAAASSGRIKVR